MTALIFFLYVTHSHANYSFFFFNEPATPEIYPLSLPDPLPIGRPRRRPAPAPRGGGPPGSDDGRRGRRPAGGTPGRRPGRAAPRRGQAHRPDRTHQQACRPQGGPGPRDGRAHPERRLHGPQLRASPDRPRGGAPPRSVRRVVVAALAGPAGLGSRI